MKRTEAVEVKEPLLQVAVVQVSIHIQTGEGPFNRIDLPVLIAIQLLKMVMGEIRSLGIRHAGRAGGGARVVALSVLKQTMVHEIGSRTHFGFCPKLFADFRPTVALPAGHLGFCRRLPNLFLNHFRLPVRIRGCTGFLRVRVHRPLRPLRRWFLRRHRNGR